MQIVQNVRCAQELQQSKAGMSGQMDERHRVPTDRDLNDDDPDLGERGIRQRGFYVALHARRNPREDRRRRSKSSSQDAGRRRLCEQRCGTQ